MAVLHFTDSDKLASSIMPDKWYGFEVVEIGEPKKSDSGKSMNMWSKFRVIDDPKYTSKQLEICFNTGMNSPSVLGTAYFMPHTALIHLAAATAGCEIEDVPEDLDTESLKGLKFDGRVTKGIYDGIVLNTLTGFLPLGVGQQKESEGSPF
jgi:hypothetical protein